MADTDRRAGLVPALLKQWRAQRGLSQLDLALLADVSARHVSFLETGRSLPSAEMVLRLGAALGAPLRQVNTMLVAAGHEPAFDEADDGLPAPVTEALELLKRHHDPFPLVIIDPTYRVLDVNRGALAVLTAMAGGAPPTSAPPAAEIEALGLNLARLTFDPDGSQPFIVNFDEVGRELLWRIQREVLADPENDALRRLLDEVLALPTIPDRWREVDLSVPSEPALVLHLRRDDLELRFLTTVTAFQAPQNVAVEQLRIEQWFPYDEPTAAACRALGETPADEPG